MPPADPYLALGSCVLRPYKTSDVDALVRAANSPRVAKWMRNTFPHPYTRHSSEVWIAVATRWAPVRDLAICTADGNDGDDGEHAGGTVMGGIGLKLREDIQYRTMELGYWLGEAYWGRGIATDAVAAFCDWAFATFPLLLRLEAHVFDGNDASARVLEKAGFAFEVRQRQSMEKNGIVMDTLVYVKFRPEGME
ncbi:acetyltransferase [Sporothrix schenckii 1099-18]|uniref:N-acetyltransferase domain-containing protein n=2 Tax=Sporothrix schenckii TaxID=29908 RepID=U7Q286_SPOS1|nr:acetyltransferase [Sporothrix schenckii 1099-18]ERT01307.1 hypothetical protein HMPREF1624_02550 [Sporothrix schenckii ATCC 58251]KJR88479.1 acetyltransferase [Sporothrix schenckii 1099-18]